MHNWVRKLLERLSLNDKVVIVSVASVKGSTPREPGAKMLVTSEEIFITDGGGNLEYKAIQVARPWQNLRR